MAIILLGATLAACTALPQAPAPKTVYDFGPAAPHASSAANTAQPALLLADVEATAALDGTAMLYRLAYANAQALQPYAQARWSMTPAQLLHLRLRQALSATRPVLLPGDPDAAQVLRVELEEFHQSFGAPQQSAGVLRLHATLLRADGRMIAQRSFSAQQPAPTGDASGGVKALAQASDAVVVQLVQWLDSAAR